jgi:hypothetical protein
MGWWDDFAGHMFEGVGSDRCCTATVVRNGENVVCGRFWTEIDDCGLDDLGKPDLAHVGALNQTELDQIIAKREAEAQQRWRIADATNSVSSRWQPLASPDSRQAAAVKRDDGHATVIAFPCEARGVLRRRLLR